MPTQLPIALDEKSRLVISRTLAQRFASGKRIKGKVTAKEASFPSGEALPESVTLDGAWKLTPSHDLEFRVNARDDLFASRTFTFRSGFIYAGAHELVLSARITAPDGGVIGCAFAFSGKWQADKNNRLNFVITRYTGRTDRLVFQGAWQVGSRNELYYRSETEKVRRTEKEEFAFGLKGSWALGARRLAYKVEGSSDSVLSFSAALQTPSIAAKDGEIRYQVGMRFTAGGKERRLVRSVAIFGKWKLGHALSVGFEAENTVRGSNRISFMLDKAVLKDGKLSLELSAEDGRRFGSEVVFSKPVTNDIDMFVSGSMFREEKRVLAGVRGSF